MSQPYINILGCGYIGKKLARQLMEKKIYPRCFVHSRASERHCEALKLSVHRFDLDQADLALDNKMKAEFMGSRIAYLVPPPRQGRQDSRMANFIHTLKASAQGVEKILLISTTGVYGDCKGEWIDENHALNPQADRAHRRLSAETQLTDYCNSEGIPLIIFRVPGIYAADKLPVKRITSGEAIVRSADSGYSNRIHADDLVAFCEEALLSNIPPGIYNCCDGQPSTMHDYFIRVADALNLPPPAEIGLAQAQQALSAGMLSYLVESKRISNKKLLKTFKTPLKYPDLQAGLKEVNINE